MFFPLFDLQESKEVPEKTAMTTVSTTVRKVIRFMVIISFWLLKYTNLFFELIFGGKKVEEVEEAQGSERRAQSTSQRSVDSAIAEERRAHGKEYTTLLQSLIRVSQKGTFFFLLMFISFCSSKKKRTKETYMSRNSQKEMII